MGLNTRYTGITWRQVSSATTGDSKIQRGKKNGKEKEKDRKREKERSKEKEKEREPNKKEEKQTKRGKERMKGQGRGKLSANQMDREKRDNERTT